MISVIIPSWNTAGLLERGLRSLLRESPTQALELIVVDDASTDDSMELVRGRFHTVRVLLQPVNAGFAAACNRGAAEAQGDWLLFLNSDAFITPAQIATLHTRASQTGAAVIGPQLVYGDGRLQDSGGSFVRPFSVTKTKLGRLLRRDLAGASHVRRVEGTVPVDWISGACFLVRADIFRQVGGFDTRFTYLEDVELCERIRRAGQLLLLTGEVRVVHLGGQSFDRIRREVPRLYRDSQRLLADRYYSAGDRLIARSAFLLERAARWALRAVERGRD